MAQENSHSEPTNKQSPLLYKVAIYSPVNQLFTYQSLQPIESGSRVVIPFGPRKLTGVIICEDDNRNHKFKLRNIMEVIDTKEPAFDSKQVQMAQWLSSYYGHPLGEVFKSMLPASIKKTKASYVAITNTGRKNILLAKIFSKKDIYTKATLLKHLQKQNLDLEELIKLKELQLTETSTSQNRTFSENSDKEDEKRFQHGTKELEVTPHPQQTLAIDSICDSLHKSEYQTFLLHGITGSGKTLVYIRCIQEMLAKNTDAQALVLVPEISLTPQMTSRFQSPFGDRVAIVHSAMTAKQRWEQLGRIKNGDASILIGPRSAVFSSFKNLKLVFVDEEHDSSYKQASGLRYNARDVAVYRCHQTKIPCVLGSATPSLETYENSLNSKYKLLEMTERPTGGSLPSHSFVKTESISYRVQSKLGSDQGDPPLLDPRILRDIQNNFEKGHQCIVIVNRRGFAYYLKNKNQDILQCPKCRISLTVHQYSTELRCHYCDYTTVTKNYENEGDLISVGYGSQRMEDFLTKKLPQLKIARLDSDTTSKKGVLEKTLTAFRNKEIHLLVGTQMLAKGHDFPNVTLVVLSDLEQMLNFADFRAGERTYQLISQASGRAGRGDSAGKVILQTSQSENEIIQNAVRGNYQDFATKEINLRKELGYPPFRRFTVMEFKSKNEKVLQEVCHKISQWVDKLYTQRIYEISQMEVLGPSTPTVDLLRGYHRQIISIFSSDMKFQRHFFDAFHARFTKLPTQVSFSIDVDAQSLL